MRTKNPVRLAARWAGAVRCALLLLGLAGCAAPPPEHGMRLQGMDPSFLDRIEQQRVPIPATPVELQADYAFPERSARHTFIWRPHMTEWRLRVMQPDYKQAGFRLRRPVKMPLQKRGMVLYFEVSPAESADTLAIGLVDCAERSQEQVAVLPIADRRIVRRIGDDAAAYSIPLQHFDGPTYRVCREGHLQPALHRHNWHAITGVHLVQLIPGPNTHSTITIKNLQIAPELWVRYLQVNPP